MEKELRWEKNEYSDEVKDVFDICKYDVLKILMEWCLILLIKKL